MIPCRTHQSQLMDYVHGLLEAEDVATLEAHLADCPACVTALERERELFGKMCRAAQGSFPEVTFTPPKPEPDIERIQNPKGNLATTLSRWAIAASLLLIVAGLGVPPLRTSISYFIHKQSVNRELAKLKQTEAEEREVASVLEQHEQRKQAKLNDAQEKHDELADQWINAEKEALSSDRGAKFRLQINGPTSIIPDAPNSYTLKLHDKVGRPLAASGNVELRTQNGSTLQTIQVRTRPQTGEASFTLPARVWRGLPVDAELTMQIRMTDEQNNIGQIRKTLSLQQPVYTTFLTTDKPMYQPGETLYFRSVTLNRVTFLPPKELLNLRFEMIAPSGSLMPGMELMGLAQPAIDQQNDTPMLINGPNGKPIEGVGSGAFTLPGNIVGGEYTLNVYRIRVNNTVKENNSKPLASRKILINNYTPDLLEKTLEFAAKTYGPGDVVQAKFTLRDQGQPVANAKLNITIQADGQAIKADVAPTKTDSEGNAAIRFTLPKKDAIDTASLTVRAQTTSIVESIVRPVPLATRTLNVEFFPEGGELVLGVPCRVYVRATTNTGKPADIHGQITDGTTKIVNVETLTDKDNPGVNQGLGVFTFTPTKGKRYALELDKPIGIVQPSAWDKQPGYLLPDAKAEGVVLHVPDAVTQPNEKIDVTLHVGDRERSLLVAAYIRNQPITRREVTVAPGHPAKLDLDLTTSSLGGVTRITVYDQTPSDNAVSVKLTPVAERLVYRQPKQLLKLNYEVLTQTNVPKESFVPGEPIQINIASKTETGEPTGAILMAAVVNQSVLRMADDKTIRTMPTHFLLGGEIEKPEELEHADFLLTDHPKAEQALDLLLGTQGWRRFALNNVTEFRQQEQAAEELLLAMGVETPMPNSWKSEVQEVFNNYWPQYQAALENLEAVERDGLNADTKLQQEHYKLMRDSAVLKSRLESSANILVPIDRAMETRRVFLPGTLLILFSLAGGTYYLRRNVVRHNPQIRRSLHFATISFALVGIIVLVLVGSSYFHDSEWKKNVNYQALEAKAHLKRRGKVVTTVTVQPPIVFPQNDAETKDKAKEFDNGIEVPPPMMMRAEVAPADFGGMAKPEARRAMVPRQFMQNKRAANKQVRPQPMMRNAKRVEAKPMAALIPGEDVARGAFAEPRFDSPLPEPLNSRFSELSKMLTEAQKTNDRRLVLQVQNEIREMIPRTPPLLIREYAHLRPTTVEEDATRADFAETLLWQPVLVTPETGEATLTLELSDSINGYQLLIAGHTLDGRIGAVSGTLQVRKPFAIDAKLPQEIRSGDIVETPIILSNATDKPLSADVNLKLTGLRSLDGDTMTATLPGNQGSRKFVRLAPTDVDRELAVQLDAVADGLTDSVRRTLTVVPEGFPVADEFSTKLKGEQTATVRFPKDRLPRTAKVTVTMYPNSLAELQAGLDGLLREPSGCFEQSSTTNYPNVLIAEYLNETDQANPELAQRVQTLMENGYGKLTSYECPRSGKETPQGYEWFGAKDNPHEALTAYGLLQFTDMSRVYPVDPKMLQRTKNYLLEARDGQGGFKRTTTAIDTFGRAPDAITDAYIVWSITEAEQAASESERTDLTKELDVLVEKAKDNADPYFVSLLANALFNVKRDKEGVKLMQTVLKLQAEDGSVPGATTSITASSGQSLLIETTALAVLGWLKADKPELFLKAEQQAMKWIGQQRSGNGGFGATQSTILALKALIQHAKSNKRPAESGTLRVFLGDTELASKPFTTDDRGPIMIDLPDIAAHFPSGDTSLTVRTDAKQEYPLSVSWECRTPQPPSDAESALKLTTELNLAEVGEGNPIQLDLTLTNMQDKGHGMAVAIVGIPAGLKLPEDMKQLKALTEIPANGKPKVGHWEIRGRELILYWRDLAPKQEVSLTLDLLADVPGEYHGPASRAYLYYTPEHKMWVAPLAVRVTRK